MPASKVKCDHPDCRGSSKKYSRLQQHKDIIHGSRTIGPGQSGGDPEGTLGGQIGRGLDAGYDFGVVDVVKASNSRGSSVVRVLPDGESRPIHVFRRTGIPVIRKIGDKRIIKVEGL